MPIHLLLPLLAAIVFPLSSMLAKRAFLEGAATGQIFHHANYLGAFTFSFLLLFVSEEVSVPWRLLYQPVIVALTIYLGAWFTFTAIRIGDVSLVAPLLGTKVIAVAVGSVILTDKSLTPNVWAASFLTAVGIFALGAKDMRKQGAVAATIALTLLSAITFGISDVLLQKWATAFDGFVFLTLMAWSIALLSLIQNLFSGRMIERFAAPAKKWIWISNACLVFQGLVMSIALAFFDDATQVNIVYGSRGLWSIVLVWAIGRQMGLSESKAPRSTMAWRLVGTALITAAIVLAMF